MLAPMRIRLLEKMVTIRSLTTDHVDDEGQQGRRALGYGRLITALLWKDQFSFTLHHPITLEAPIDEVKVIPMTKGERARRAQGRVREEQAHKDEEEELEEEDLESEAQDSGPAEEERRVATYFQASVLEMPREMWEESKAMGAQVASVEKRASCLVTAWEREARAAGQESRLPRRRFTLAAEQEETEEETGETSGEGATDGKEDTTEGAEIEASQFAEVEEEQRRVDEAEAEAEAKGTEEVRAVVREEELGSVRDVTAEEVGASDAVDVRHLAEVTEEVAEAKEEEQLRHISVRPAIAPVEGSSREE